MKIDSMVKLSLIFLLLIYVKDHVRITQKEIKKNSGSYRSYTDIGLIIKFLVENDYLFRENGRSLRFKNNRLGSGRNNYYSITPKGLQFAEHLEVYHYDTIKYTETKD